MQVADGPTKRQAAVPITVKSTSGTLSSKVSNSFAAREKHHFHFLFLPTSFHRLTQSDNTTKGIIALFKIQLWLPIPYHCLCPSCDPHLYRQIQPCLLWLLSLISRSFKCTLWGTNLLWQPLPRDVYFTTWVKCPEFQISLSLQSATINFCSRVLCN